MRGYIPGQLIVKVFKGQIYPGTDKFQGLGTANLIS